MQNQSELTVILKAKDLCSYIIAATQKSPKQYRYTFVSRMQNLSLDVIECLYRANDIYVAKGNVKNMEKRLDLQGEAVTDLKLLAYISQLAYEQKCILMKQFEQISILSTECLHLAYAWMQADRKRFGG